MRIALVAPLAEAVPPRLYGATERVVSWLAEELVSQGHRVTLIASAESEAAAELVVCAARRLRLAGVRGHLGSTLAMLREIRRRADEFDIIHFHVDLLPQALFHELAHKCLVTLHGRLDLPDALPLYKAFPELPLVSISNAQRRPMPADANWLATIPHGLASHVCPFNPEGGSYLAFLEAFVPRSMELRHEVNSVSFRDPAMPAFLDYVTLNQLSLGKSRLDLRLHRHGRDVTLNLLRRQGDAKVMLIK